jgi:pimeloyl-ACP methyl ester carboxylesterase
LVDLVALLLLRTAAAAADGKPRVTGRMNQQRFRISFSEDRLVDLRQRLRNTRWMKDPVPNAAYGVSAALLQDLVEKWVEKFSWKDVQEEMNRYDQFRVTIAGQSIHFLRIASPEQGAIPLILTHGWPWTFWDMRRVFESLTDPINHGGNAADAFDLIVPSLPGFLFSTPLSPAGNNFWHTADLWHRLMTDVLGFTRYGAAGGDWGALVSSQLGHKYASHLVGVHVTQPVPLATFSTGHPWRARAAGSPEPGVDTLQFERRFASHLAVHMIEPDTLAHALSDSPAGMLAWLLQRWCSWGAAPGPGLFALTDQQMLTNATLYWMTESLPSSLRYYANAGLDPWRPSHRRRPLVEAPTGVTMLAGDLPEGTDLKRLIARFANSTRGSQYNLVDVNAHAQGGHFAHLENPEAVVADIRATFRAARAIT